MIAERCPFCGGDETKCDFSFQSERCSQMIGDDSGPKTKIGDMATHGGDIRITDNLAKFRSSGEQRIINLLFEKLLRGDKPGLERSLRNKSVASLRRRGVLTVERAQ